MYDKIILEEMYKEMYDALIAKQRNELERIFDKTFVLIRMSGIVQTRAEFIYAVENQTINYYSASHERIKITLHEETALIKGQSRVEVCVNGGKKEEEALLLMIHAKKIDGQWVFERAEASSYMIS